MVSSKRGGSGGGGGAVLAHARASQGQEVARARSSKAHKKSPGGLFDDTGKNGFKSARGDVSGGKNR